MTSGLLKRSRHSTLKKSCPSKKDLTIRLPDFGPLNITNYEKFKKTSKIIFYQKWTNPISFFKTTAYLSDFVRLGPLGSGAFGVVVLVRHNQTKKLYAMKCLEKEHVVKNDQVENLKNEKLILQCIDFPFIIYLVNTLKDNSYIYFVLLFVEGGDLFGHMKLIGKGHEDKAKFYASQVVLALEYLHYLDFVYRDLKPENVLLDRTGYLKLADFGFAKHLKPRLRTYTLCGTPEYIAPEVVLNKGHGKAVDWWAVGCFIYELVAGHSPFVADRVERIYEKIITRNLKFPQYFSPELKQLIGHLLQNDLSKRYGNMENGVNDIKNHKWLLTINWLAVLNRKVEPPYKPKIPSLDSKETTPLKFPKTGLEDTYSVEFADF